MEGTVVCMDWSSNWYVDGMDMDMDIFWNERMISSLEKLIFFNMRWFVVVNVFELDGWFFILLLFFFSRYV